MIITVTKHKVYKEVFERLYKAITSAFTSLQDQYEIVKEYIKSESGSTTPVNFTDFQAGVYQKLKGHTDDGRDIKEFVKGVNWVDFMVDLNKFLPFKRPEEITIEGPAKKDIQDCSDTELDLAIRRFIDHKFDVPYIDLQRKFEALVS